MAIYSLINLAITNSIRGLARISESLMFMFTSVDSLPCITLEKLNRGLMRKIINNFSPCDYPAKICCRLSTSAWKRALLFPIS